MKMDIKLLTIPPKKIVNKYVSSRELKRYFGDSPVEALVVALRQGLSEGLFGFDITLDPDYIEWGEAWHKAQFPVDFSGSDLGYVRSLRYKFEDLSYKIISGESLSENEIQRIIGELPRDITEKYLRFRLCSLDYDKLKKIVSPKKKSHKKDTYVRIERDGLVIDGATVFYNDKLIDMGFQHRQVLRVLLEHYDHLVEHDTFINNRDIFSKEDYKKDLKERIGQIISEVHNKLRIAIGEDCISNTQSEGWTLKIK